MTGPDVDVEQLYGAPRHDTSVPTPERRCYDERSGWDGVDAPVDVAGAAPSRSSSTAD